MSTTNVYVDALRLTVSYTSGGVAHVAGPALPTSAASVDAGDDSGYYNVPWQHPLNICAVDGSDLGTLYSPGPTGYAIAGPCASGANVTDRLVGAKFGFSIPTGATITDITAEAMVTTDCGQGYTAEPEVALLKGGVRATDFYKNVYYFEGGQCIPPTGWTVLGTGLWGHSWTAEDINSPTFGLIFRMGADWCNTSGRDEDGGSSAESAASSVLTTVTQASQITVYTPSTPAGSNLTNYAYGGVNFSDPTQANNPNNYNYAAGGLGVLQPTGYSGYSAYGFGTGLYPFTPTNGIVLPSGYSAGTMYGILNLLNGLLFGYGYDSVR